MNEMVERVAREIVRATNGDPDASVFVMNGVCLPLWRGYTDAAKAAIAAMREPTEAMFNAGDTALAVSYGVVDLTAAWRAMIDAALRD